MQRNLTHLNHHYFLLLVLFSLVFISCVYFNTFYNAETSFKKALQIIEESPIIDNDELPSQATKLLSEAIENSRLILEEYPNSKYIDDAVFIIAKASFLRDEVAIAESHFNLLIRDYPESKFYSLSEIWLAYTHFRRGMVDSAKTSLEIIQAGKPKNKEKLYIIHNVLAEISKEIDSTEQVYYHYELAAENAASNSKKTSTFGKLIKIAEEDQDKERASIYLEKLGEVAPDNIRIDSKMQWITYQRELGNFDKIIDEIESMLGLSEFAAEYMKLELELGKVYMDKGDIPIAKDIFTQMVENYSKKEETAEAYYHLGFMALMEDFNLDLTKEYFEKSKLEKSQSKYGKESKEFFNKIARFESLQGLYKDVVKKSKEEVEYNETDIENVDNDTELEDTNLEAGPINNRDGTFPRSNKYKDSRNQMDFDISGMLDDEELQNQNEMSTLSASPDSVLFMIGEMLLYDFNRQELSLEKFKSLAKEYPQSKFASQALYVLSRFEPDSDWQRRLETDFPNSSFLSTDSTTASLPVNTLIESQRDYAWSLAQTSYEDSYKEFNRLFSEENDTLSGYISGFISDYYLNDMERTVKHYQLFAESFPDHSYSTMAENRLKEIKQDLEDLKEISQQGIDYQGAVIFLHNEFDYDSVKVLLSEISSGVSSPYREAANSLKSTIRDYEELYEEVHQQKIQSVEDSISDDISMAVPPVETEMDSILFQIAELFAHELEFVDSAKFYHNELILSYNDSKFRPYSLLYLSEIFPEGNWSKLLAEEYPDTTFTSEASSIYHSIYPADIFQDDFVARQKTTINNCESYLELFPEPVDSSLKFPDSTKIEFNSLLLFSDSSEVQIDSTKLPSSPPIISVDSSSVPINSDSLYQTLQTVKEKLTP